MKKIKNFFKPVPFFRPLNTYGIYALTLWMLGTMFLAVGAL